MNRETLVNTKDLLLHMCCGPCTEYPLEVLREEGFLVSGYFYNPNIQPQAELDRRLENVKILSEKKGFSVVYDDTCAEETWRNFASPHKSDHCRYCYYSRMYEVARFAKEQGFHRFTTSLLVSPYQNHELLIKAAEAAATHYGIEFLYRDFRPGYRQGQEMAKADGLYRQKYCGCIYSLGESNYQVKIMKQLNLTPDQVPARLQD